MLRSILSRYGKNTYVLLTPKQTFLTNSYSCTETWNSRLSSPIIKSINLEDFYNSLDQTHSSKGVISAIDVDIFANSIKDNSYLEELRDLLHKLRLSADTQNTLGSTHYATIRNYLEHGNLDDLVDIVKDHLNYGIFLNDFSANIILDKLINLKEYEKAAIVAGQVMLQEDFSHDVTCSLCQYACYKYVLQYEPPAPAPPPSGKVEEVKIRVGFLRNPYFDDHFDITDVYQLSGKTLAWISEIKHDNLNVNLELLGWLAYQKYNELLACCDKMKNTDNVKIYKETIEIVKREASRENIELEAANVLEKCLTILSNLSINEQPLEEALKINIENAINKKQSKDISEHQKVIKLYYHF